MTGNEIVSVLADDGSFVELKAVQKRGVLTGMCTLAARPLCIAATEDECADAKGCEDALIALFDMALKIGAPVVWRIAANEAVFADGRLQRAIAMISGVCPVIVLTERALTESAKAAAEMCDFRVQIACADAAAGCCDLCAADDIAALDLVRSLLFMLPGNCAEDAPMIDAADILESPADSKQVFDSGSELKLHEDWCGAVSLARIVGRSAAVIAMREQSVMRGLGRFIRLCDCFSLPVVWVSDMDFPLNDAYVTHAVAAMTSPKLLVRCSGSAPEALFDYVVDGGVGNAKSKIRAALNLLISKRECCLPPRKHDNVPLR